MLTPVPQPHWQTKHNASGARMKSCTTPALLTTLPVSVCVCVIPQLLQFQTQNTCMLYTHAHAHSAFVLDFFGFMPLMINSELEK